MNWREPIFYRIDWRWRLLESLSSLVMVFLILSAMWMISSTWSMESLSPWVMWGVLLMSSMESMARSMAVLIPADAVSKQEGGAL